MLPSTQSKGGAWARGRSAANEPRSTSRPRASSRSRGSAVIPSAARPSSQSAKRSTSPPPVRAASVALPVTAQSTAWVPKPKPVSFSPELAKWAHTLITAYHANNSKLGRMARSGLDQLEAWRQQVEPRDASGQAGAARSLHELHSMQQTMMLQLADLKQQLAEASAAEDTELLRSSTAAVETTPVSSIGQADSTDATATSAAAASVAAIVTADAPIVTTAAAAVAAGAGPADIASLALTAASTVPVAPAAPASTAADSYGVRLANWADGLITQHLGASLVLPRRKQSRHLSLRPWEVAVSPIGPHLAQTAREQHAVHGAAASSDAASLAQLRQRWEEELWLFKAEGDAVLRELETLQQQHLAHITAVAAAGEQAAWQEQWGKAHAEIRMLADAAAGAVVKPTVARLSVPASAATTPASTIATPASAAVMPASAASMPAGAAATPAAPAAQSSHAQAETEGGESVSVSTAAKGAASQQPYTGGRRAAKRAVTRVRAVAERTSLSRMVFAEADMEGHSGTEQQVTEWHQAQRLAAVDGAVQLPLVTPAVAAAAPAPPCVLPSAVVSVVPVATSGPDALPSAFDALPDNGDLPAVSRQAAAAPTSKGKPAGWDVFGQLLYVTLRKM